MAKKLILNSGSYKEAVNVPLRGFDLSTYIEDKVSSNSSTPTLPYKVYLAILNQVGVEDPTVVSVLENTIGNVTWARTAQGVYQGILPIEAPVEKTIINIADNGGGVYKITGYHAGEPAPNYKVGIQTGVFMSQPPVSEGALGLVTNLETVVAPFTPSDEVLYNTSIEIRIYP